MVFDAFLNGFAISEKYSFNRDEETKKLNAEVVEKIASFSNGIFHLVKGKGEDELWFIVGHIHEGLTELGYETIFFLNFFRCLKDITRRRGCQYCNRAWTKQTVIHGVYD